MFRSSLVLTTINNGVLNAIKAMPQKDSTSDNTSSFSMGRHVFIDTYTTKHLTSNQYNQKKWIGGNRDASQVTTNYRNSQIGTGSVNAGGKPIAFTTYKDVNVVDDALRRVRSGGAVAPPKKAVSPIRTYGPTPSFQPRSTNMKSIYGIKIPSLYH